MQPGLDPVFCLENRLWLISKEGLKPEVDRAPRTWRIMRPLGSRGTRGVNSISVQMNTNHSSFHLSRFLADED